MRANRMLRLGTLVALLTLPWIDLAELSGHDHPLLECGTVAHDHLGSPGDLEQPPSKGGQTRLTPLVVIHHSACPICLARSGLRQLAASTPAFGGPPSVTATVLATTERATRAVVLERPASRGPPPAPHLG